MLPDVISQDREQSLRDRVILIGRGENLHAAVWFAGEPNPSGAKLLSACIAEFGLEILQVPEGLLNDVGNWPVRVSATLRLHDLPEHAVIHMSAAVIAYGSADVFRNGIQITQ